MKRVFWIALPLAVALLASPAAAQIDWFAQLSGDGQGFAALRTDSGSMEYNIVTNGLGTPSTAEVLVNGTPVNLGASFDFGSASGTASVGSIPEGASLTLRVSGAAGTLSGPIQFVAEADDGGGGEPGDGLDDDTTDPCVDGPSTVCLRDGRFEVTATFTLQNGQSGSMGADNTTDDTGQLFFNNPNNVEVFVKVLDACGINQNYWVFLAGLTDQGISLKVRDTQEGKSRTYSNPLGTVFTTVTGTTPEGGSFPTCP